MVDKNTTPGDKKLSVPGKTLTLKPRVETGTVRQSFPHGRTKQVVVEKRGKRRVGGDMQVAEAPHAPEPVAAKAAPAAKAPLGGRPAASPQPGRAAQRLGRGAPHADRGRARRARQRARRCPRSRNGRAAGGGRGSQAARQPRRHRAGRTRSRRSPPQGRGRAPSPRRRGQAQGRTRGQEAFRRD